MTDGDTPPETGDAQEWARAESRIEEFLLGGARHLTRLDVRERTDLPPEQSTRLWNALGFPAAADDTPAFTDADVEALGQVGRLLSQDTFDDAEALAVARTLGQTMARLAEWQANLVRRTIAEAGAAQDPQAVTEALESIVPLLERIQTYAWRRHLAVTAGRMLAGLAHPDAGGDEDVVVVGFADVVGFTTLSRKIDTDELRSLLERFESVAGDVVSRHGGRVVKTLGDEILFVCGDVAGAVAIATGLQEEIPDEQGRLQLRIGLAQGEVLPRYGDVYGPVVNIASRLTSHARPGSILVDDALTDAIREAGLDVELKAVPPVNVRGYKHLKPHTLRATSTR